MSVIYVALAALCLSLIPVVILCVHDPKRRRATGEKHAAAPVRRWLLATAACVPGLACAIFGESAAFMMWLGGCALIGWGAAGYFSARFADPVR